MGYSTGAKFTADIVDDIANGLIASLDPIDGLPKWSDIITVDTGATMWNTTTRTGNSAKRALRYLNGTETIYLSLEIINASTQVKAAYSNPYTYYTQSKGIIITFSQSWNSVTHSYPVSNQQSFIQFETNPYSVANSNPVVNADLASLYIYYYLWIESNGFALMGKPDVYSSDANQQSFILVVERNPNKEYIDGYTNFYAFMWQNIFRAGWDAYSSARFRSILRPFAYQYPDTGNYDDVTLSGAGISFVAMPSYYAYKSVGDNKVYYVKPLIHNVAGQNAPIFQSDLFFLWTEMVGLISGDVIAIEGTSKKYVCWGLDSPNHTQRITFAMKYASG
jgi:hypothetical protein